jgi:hypothetical protein
MKRGYELSPVPRQILPDELLLRILVERNEQPGEIRSPQDYNRLMDLMVIGGKRLFVCALCAIKDLNLIISDEILKKLTIDKLLIFAGLRHIRVAMHMGSGGWRMSFNGELVTSNKLIMFRNLESMTMTLVSYTWLEEGEWVCFKNLVRLNVEINYSSSSYTSFKKILNHDMMPLLKSLTIYVCNCVFIDTISRLTKLEELSIRHGNILNDDILVTMTELKMLEVNNAVIFNTGITSYGIKSLTKLKTLHFECDYRGVGEGVACLTNLEDLYITGSSIGDNYLEKLVNLKVLRLEDCDYVTDTCFSKLVNLVSIHTNNCHHIPNTCS